MRRITYLDIPDFQIAIERVKDKSLCAYPVAIATPNSKTAKIICSSPEARVDGVHRGMNVIMAKRYCQKLKIIAPNIDLYRSVQKKLMNEMSRLISLFEADQQGRLFLDTTGYQGLYGPDSDLAMKLRQHIKERLSLESVLGVAQNKMVSKIATKTLVTSEDIIVIKKGDESSFLAPLSYKELPICISIFDKNPNMNIFEELNIKTFLCLRSLDLYYLQIAFGGFAQTVYNMVRGIDSRPIIPLLQRPSIFEEYYLETQTNNANELIAIFSNLLERAVYRLRINKQVCGRIYLGFRYRDFKYCEEIKKLKTPLDDGKILLEQVQIIFNRL